MHQQTSTGLTLKPTPWLHPAIWLLACLMLALMQITWAGYQLGVGNQGIQIAFIQKLHDGELFANDAMVRQTLASYPSFFFHLISHFLAFADLPTLYLALHLIATAGVFAAIIALSTAVTRNRWTGLVCSLFLLAGHHQALAGESLYSTGFTHTWAIFPLSLLALYLFFRDRYVIAFLLAGLIFNFHALEAGHLLVIMGLAAFLDGRRVGMKQLAASAAAFAFAALPTVLVMLRQRHDAGFHESLWLQLMYIRSADHSFPSSWWQKGTPDIPRFLSVIGLAALALSFRMPPRMKRKTLLLVLGIGLMFLTGYIFTDIRPAPLVIRAQFFRSSRLLYMLSLIVIAHACVKGWRLPWHHSKTIPAWAAWLEFASATLTALCLTLPALMPAAPWALAIALTVALLNGRLAWYEALVAGASLLVCLIATQKIDFVIPGIAVLDAEHHWLFTRIQWSAFLENRWPGGANFLVGVCAIGLAVAAASRIRGLSAKMLLAAGAVVALTALVLVLPAVKRTSEGDPAWADVQLWVQAHTPKSAVILTPPQESGFRIFSQRSIVGEYRDGTQLYFNADFARTWWDRMNALQPGRVVAADKKSVVNPGIPLDRLDDEKIVRLASEPVTRADYIVLPKVETGGMKANTHGMKVAYENRDWVVMEPKFLDLSGRPGDATLLEEDKFIRQVALPNIQRNRQSDVRILVVDSAGKSVQGAAYRITQLTSAFNFGCSLLFFQVPDVDTKADYKPPAITSLERDRFLELFNYSVIPFSAQWRFTEPAEGKPDYTDLDLYVNWCAEHGIRPEFRFLAGYQPAWMKAKLPRDQGEIVLAHAEALAKRYGDKIQDWQVTSEDVGLREIGMEEYDPKVRAERVTTFFSTLRKLLPHARLGISDDARFFSPKIGIDAKTDMLRGLDTLRDLKKLGVAIDFISLEAKHPLGLWASGKSINDTLDLYANEGVKIHLTEFGVAVGDRIEGPVQEGVWTRENQADYYERFFTICYGNPAVEAINIMGIGDTTWRPGQGLLDAADTPTPAFNKLKDLLTKRWRTNLADKLGAGGSINYRGYHGNYELALTLPGGKTAKANFTVAPLAAGADLMSVNSFRFVLRADGTLQLAEEK